MTITTMIKVASQCCIGEVDVITTRISGSNVREVVKDVKGMLGKDGADVINVFQLVLPVSSASCSKYRPWMYQLVLDTGHKNGVYSFKENCSPGKIPGLLPTLSPAYFLDYFWGLLPGLPLGLLPGLLPS